MKPEVCPNCGADVPRKALACPECGACEETAWSDDAQAADLGLSEEEFSYDEYVQREFGPKRLLGRGKSWVWWGISLIITALLVWVFLR